MAGTYTEAQAKATKKYREAHKEDLRQYNKEYDSKVYSIKIRMTQEQKEILHTKAKADNKSINQYILDKIL